MQPRTTRLCVAIDLTSIGAEDFRVRFVDGLVQHALETTFVLLSVSANAALVQHIEGPNVRHATIDTMRVPFERLIDRIDARLPARVRRKRRLSTFRRPGLLARLGASVAFWPYTSSTVYDPFIPLVACLHDLSHVTSPHVLTSRQRAARARALEATLRYAARVVCPTDAVKTAALTLDDGMADRLATLHPGRLLLPTGLAAAACHGDYVLLIGELEPRNNHALALTSFAQFRAKHPDSDLTLVCAAAPGPSLASLRDMLARLGLGASARVVETSTHDELIALIRCSRALLLPSLYDSIGESLLLAMALGRSVLCGTSSTYLELAGDSAIRFDPHRPAELVAAIERLAYEPCLARRSAERGVQKVAALAEPAAVAAGFVTILGEAQCKAPSR